jgi:hypothetical protein
MRKPYNPTPKDIDPTSTTEPAAGDKTNDNLAEILDKPQEDESRKGDQTLASVAEDYTAKL